MLLLSVSRAFPGRQVAVSDGAVAVAAAPPEAASLVAGVWSAIERPRDGGPLAVAPRARQDSCIAIERTGKSAAGVDASGSLRVAARGAAASLQALCGAAEADARKVADSGGAIVVFGTGSGGLRLEAGLVVAPEPLGTVLARATFRPAACPRVVAALIAGAGHETHGQAAADAVTLGLRNCRRFASACRRPAVRAGRDVGAVSRFVASARAAHRIAARACRLATVSGSGQAADPRAALGVGLAGVARTPSVVAGAAVRTAERGAGRAAHRDREQRQDPSSRSLDPRESSRP